MGRVESKEERWRVRKSRGPPRETKSPGKCPRKWPGKCSGKFSGKISQKSILKSRSADFARHLQIPNFWEIFPKAPGAPNAPKIFWEIVWEIAQKVVWEMVQK